VSWPEIVTLAIAVLGAALGIINTCHAMWRDRVRLRVYCGTWIFIPNYGETSEGPQVTIVNLSGYTVFIDQITFVTLEKDVRAHFEALPNQEKLPFSMEPRASRTIKFVAGEEDRRIAKPLCCRVVTSCEKVLHATRSAPGDSPMTKRLRWLRDWFRK
jgi:hypothetical protein